MSHYSVEHQQVNILFKVCLPLEMNAYVYLGSGAAALAGAVLVSGQRAWSAALLLRSVRQHFLSLPLKNACSGNVNLTVHHI